MRANRPSEHDDAVERRLDLLARELAGVRSEHPVGQERVGHDAGGGGEVDQADPWDLPAVDDAPVGRHPLARPVAPVPLTPPTPRAVVLPVPGRHASRRAGEGVRAVTSAATGRAATRVWPPAVRGAFTLGAPHVAVVATVVALGLALTAWWVVRADPGQDQAPASTATTDGADLVALAPVAAEPTTAEVAGAAGGAATGPSPAGTATGTGEVVVDVAGDVRRPGIAVLPTGSRVVDALEAAGGARPGVDLTSLNLARPLVDGEQVVVGGPPGAVDTAPVSPVVPGVTSPSAGGAAPVAIVNLNTADQATLETLPEVGPVTAAAILAWRDQHGGFTAVEELLEVDGIGDKTLATLAPHVSV